ncbi:dethiobiotin synthase [Brachyspira hampsonii]|uniref:ATP-dependent dethiobiotin synthetase BioD n=1 Tax=Brachyspira hampsonii TaxID=1287055 RepID=A0AAC9TVQ4_9SPIR|nr:dethiobiotin synthase [Brachyspira hampsonii]ASJ21744.1 dethiobiotin synthase [Brachyspira hampsonii]ELV05439.1 dethiobiotin synthetase [Brachyspira hampsonii 30599]MBW5380988.1 dethiobiotin synthase [Brachyspira hampsonii]MBW5409305.1 dethiobiotin synthase [Brachyspira hampsonii]OEJ18801.1 dethiobiotin synthase [Brachyspira hampsonii]
MAKALFITATGTDIGKTYVSALIAKNMKDKGLNIGYYKAALSGSDDITDSDAWYVKEKANLKDSYDEMVSYTYKHAYSPHLAAQIEGNPPNMEFIKNAYKNIDKVHDYMIVEGSGGIICPIRYDNNKKIFLEDIIKELDLPSLIVADAGLGTINSTVLTIEYMRSKKLKINGVILNRFEIANEMHDDNKKMIEDITGIKIIGFVIDGILKLDDRNIENLFE